MRQDSYSGPSEAGPDEAFMDQICSRLPPIPWTLDSPHFDCFRVLLPKLDLLRRSGNEACIPSASESAAYFDSGVQLLGLPSGYVYMVPGSEPFVVAHGRAYSGRRLFTTQSGSLGMGPASIKPRDNVCLVPGFQEMMILRQAPQDFLMAMPDSAIGRGLLAMKKEQKR